MKSDRKIIALIPLRGGSQSIPLKNIRPLAGRPLCDWVIRAALDSGLFARVWVSTDNDEIARIAEKSGARVHRRAPETATDTASTESAMLDFARTHFDFDVLALIQATSPLTLPEHFTAAYKQFCDEKADSLVTVTRSHRFRWSAGGAALNYEPAKRPRRQEWGGEMIENGAFYFTKREILQSTKCRLGGKVAIYEMPAPTAFEIDEPEDWVLLEMLARRHGHHTAGLPIKLLVLDVDGVLTDAGFYYDEKGEALKKFSTRDGEGIRQAREAGVEVGIITGEKTGFAPARATKLGISRIEIGCREKLPVLDKWRQELGLKWEEVAYMGDDIPDIPCLEAAGLGACPVDAVKQVQEVARWIAPTAGGRGAVRALIEDLREKNLLGSASNEGKK